MRAGPHIRLELPCRTLGPAGTADAVEVRVGEYGKAVGMLRAERPDGVAKSIAVPAAEVHQHRQIERVHFGDDPIEPFRRGGAAVMAMHVDGGELRARDRMLLHNKCRARFPVFDAQFLGDSPCAEQAAHNCENSHRWHHCWSERSNGARPSDAEASMHSRTPTGGQG